MNFIRALLFLFLLPHCGLRWGEDPPPTSSFNQASVGGACADQDYKKAFASYFFEEGESFKQGEKNSLSSALNCLADTITETKDFFYDESLNRAELIQLLQQDFVRTQATAPIVDHILSPDYNYLDHYIGIKTSLVEMMIAGEEGRFVAEDSVCGHLSYEKVFSKEDADALVRFLRAFAHVSSDIAQQSVQIERDLNLKERAESALLLLNDESFRQQFLLALTEVFKESHPAFSRFLETSFSPTVANENRELLFRSLFKMAGLFPGPTERLGVPQIKYILLNLYITSKLVLLYDTDGDFVISHQESKPLSCLTSRWVSLAILPHLQKLPYSVQAFLNPQVVSDYILDRQKLPLSEDGSLNWDYFPYFFSAHPRDPKSVSYSEMSSLVSTLFATGFFFHKISGQNRSDTSVLSKLFGWMRPPQGTSDSPIGSSQILGTPDSNSAGTDPKGSSSENPSSSAVARNAPLAPDRVPLASDLVVTAESLQTLSNQWGFPVSPDTAEQILFFANRLFDTVKRVKADPSSLCDGSPPLEQNVDLNKGIEFLAEIQESGDLMKGMRFLAEVQESSDGFFESFFADPEVLALLSSLSVGEGAGPLGSKWQEDHLSQEILTHSNFNRLFVLKLADWFEERWPGWSRFLRDNLSADGLAEAPHPEKSSFFAEQVMADLWEIAGGVPASMEVFRANARFVFLHIYINNFLLSLWDQDKDFVLSPEEQKPLSCLYAGLFEVAGEPFLNPYNDLVRDFLAPKALADYFISRGESAFWSGKSLSFNEELARFARGRLLEEGGISSPLSYGGMSRHLLQWFSLAKGFILSERQAFDDEKGFEISALAEFLKPTRDEGFFPTANNTLTTGDLEGFTETSFQNTAFYPWLIRLFKAPPEQTLVGSSGPDSSIGSGHVLTKQAFKEFVEKSGHLLPQDIDTYLLILKDAVATAGLYQEGWSVPAESVCGVATAVEVQQPLPLDFEIFSNRDSLILNKMLESLSRILPEAEQDSQHLFVSLQKEWESYDGLSKTELTNGALSTRFVSVLISHFKDTFPEQARFWDEIFLQKGFEASLPRVLPPTTGEQTSLEYEFPLPAIRSRSPLTTEGPMENGDFRNANFPRSLTTEGPLTTLAESDTVNPTPLNPQGLSESLSSRKAQVLWKLLHRPFKSQDHLSAQNIRSFVLNAYTAQALFDVLDYDGDLRLSLEELRPLACLASRLLRVALRPLRERYRPLNTFPLSQVVVAYLLEHQSMPPFIDMDGVSLAFQWDQLPESGTTLAWFFRDSLQSRSQIFDLSNPLLSQEFLVEGEGSFDLSVGELSLLTALMYSAGYDVLEAFLYGQREQEVEASSTSREDSFTQFLQKIPLDLDGLRDWGHNAKTWWHTQIENLTRRQQGHPSTDREEGPSDNPPTQDSPLDDFLYPSR